MVFVNIKMFRFFMSITRYTHKKVDNQIKSILNNKLTYKIDYCHLKSSTIVSKHVLIACTIFNTSEAFKSLKIDFRFCKLKNNLSCPSIENSLM